MKAFNYYLLFMNKRGFQSLRLFADFLLPLAPFFFTPLYFPGSFFIPCTPAGLEPLTFRITLAYQSLLYTTTLQSSVENYSLKIIFLFYIAMYSFICLTRVSCCTKICIGFFNQLGPWWVSFLLCSVRLKTGPMVQKQAHGVFHRCTNVFVIFSIVECSTSKVYEIFDCSFRSCASGDALLYASCCERCIQSLLIQRTSNLLSLQHGFEKDGYNELKQFYRQTTVRVPSAFKETKHTAANEVLWPRLGLFASKSELYAQLCLGLYRKLAAGAHQASHRKHKDGLLISA